MKYSWEVCGDAWIDDRECYSVCCFSPMGIETWLYVEKSTGELLMAEQIDGEWNYLDVGWAKEEFKEVLYAVS